MNLKALHLSVSIMAVACGQSILAAPPITFDSLLKEMTDRDAVARWPQPAYTCREASSYDRRSKTPTAPDGWFANDDWSQFIRSEEHQGRREWVMMDATGPGAVVRFWTAGKLATGTVRFYLDGAAEPSIAAELQDLLCGRGVIPHLLAIENPKQAGNSYLPIPYSKHCKITYEEVDPKNPTGPPPQRWYNIEYRTYPADTSVKSFSMEDLKSAKTMVGQVQTALAGQENTSPGQQASLDREIEPGKAADLTLPSGSAALRQLEIHPSTTDAQALRSLVLRIEFDGEQTIWCPLSDFFGSGVGVNVLKSWQRSVSQDGTMICHWVMPYKTSARLSLLNLGKQKIGVKLKASVGAWKWDERSMHFHANWRQQHSIATQPRTDWNYITATGKGVYVGDTLCVFNPVSGWWGEGDEKIRVDGEAFPSHFGTGTEDYYGYAWCDPSLFQSPFANQVRCDGAGNLGNTVVTRTRSLDAIPFEKSLHFDMEIWHWLDCHVGYAATTYWYAMPGATSNREPAPEEAVREIPGLPGIKGAIECETMSMIAQTNGLSIQKQAGGLKTGDWSGGTQLFVQGRKPGDFVELKIPSPSPSPQKMILHATKSWDYGILRFSVNGKPTGKDFDAYNTTAILSEPIELGVFKPKDGQFTLRVEVVGTNPASKEGHYFFGLDCVVLDQP